MEEQWIWYYHSIKLTVNDKMKDDIIKAYKEWWNYTIDINIPTHDIKARVKDLIIDWITKFN